MELKKVLMIAYQFPPMGGSGVQRSAKFAKYLGGFGWTPTVFTVKASEGLLDATMLEELAGIEVIRSTDYNLEALKKPFRLIGKVISRKLLIPDGQWLWHFMNRKKVVRYIRENQPDVLYTTSYPYSDHLIGAYVKKKFPNLPWVVDFRDEWTQNLYIVDMNFSKFRMHLEKKMEQQVIGLCDYFITNSPQMLENFKRAHDLENRSYVIPNGFDQSDFEGLTIDDTTHEKMVITYAGAMYGRRKADPFLQALKNVIADGKVAADMLKVNFIGNFTQDNINKLKGYLGNDELITFVPYLPHKKSIEFLMNSDALLLIVGSGVGARNFYTGKIFEYINTHKTILALVPEDGAAADVIRETKTGYVVESEDVEKIEKALIDIYTRWQAGTLDVQTNWDAVNQYDRINLTKQLSEIFNRCLGR